MEVEQQPADPSAGGPPAFDAFLQTGRTGRRNALPDILEEGATNVSTASLPCSFQNLSCSDSPAGTSAGGSSPSPDKPSTSEGPPKS
ncbi:uncharacterized protein LOC8025090 [Ixodes scapularis]|uniref:cAMP-dependent protein kinase inhibitor beta n=1 Tax=Ixodes scapularis TaxID=6945 RepID=B7P5W6_IXOSC|nr:uncharacterized protein LOC8025090 [Ixodes scapularis]XP_042147814.1 uncharacterized protein LOC8025090 [Ixodes scapularis]EEC01988.1 conserved hypothetical protein [Ixodes scapularis]|eukprot:XP_002408051.1 conserved hypothetical protein [Ixodes scapularis]